MLLTEVTFPSLRTSEIEITFPKHSLSIVASSFGSKAGFSKLSRVKLIFVTMMFLWPSIRSMVRLESESVTPGFRSHSDTIMPGRGGRSWYKFQSITVVKVTLAPRPSNVMLLRRSSGRMTLIRMSFANLIHKGFEGSEVITPYRKLPGGPFGYFAL